jgi:hypothetical protein
VYTAVQLGTNATKRETLAIKVATQTPGFSWHKLRVETLHPPRKSPLRTSRQCHLVFKWRSQLYRIRRISVLVVRWEICCKNIPSSKSLWYFRMLLCFDALFLASLHSIVTILLYMLTCNRPCGDMGRVWDSLLIAKGSGRSPVPPARPFFSSSH